MILLTLSIPILAQAFHPTTALHAKNVHSLVICSPQSQLSAPKLFIPVPDIPAFLLPLFPAPGFKLSTRLPFLAFLVFTNTNCVIFLIFLGEKAAKSPPFQTQGIEAHKTHGKGISQFHKQSDAARTCLSRMFNNSLVCSPPPHPFWKCPSHSCFLPLSPAQNVGTAPLLLKAGKHLQKSQFLCTGCAKQVGFHRAAKTHPQHKCWT